MTRTAILVVVLQTVWLAPVAKSPGILRGKTGTGLATGRSCCCSEREPTYRVADATDAIFVGLVTGVRHAQIGDSPVSTRRVQLQVLELFRGPIAGEVELTADSCVQTAVGMTYLVYASFTAAGLTIPPCGRTRPIENATEDLDFLRVLNEGRQPGSTLYGQIHIPQMDARERIIALMALPREVRLVLEGGRMEVESDWRGQFEFNDIPAGRYRVRAVDARVVAIAVEGSGWQSPDGVVVDGQSKLRMSVALQIRPGARDH